MTCDPRFLAICALASLAVSPPAVGPATAQEPGAATESRSSPDSGSTVRVEYADTAGNTRVGRGRFAGSTATSFRIEVVGGWSHMDTVEIAHSAIRRVDVCSGCSRTREVILVGAGTAIGYLAGAAVFKPDESDCIMCFTARDFGNLMGQVGAALVGTLIGTAINNSLEDWENLPIDEAVSVEVTPGAGPRAELRIRIR